MQKLDPQRWGQDLERSSDKHQLVQEFLKDNGITGVGVTMRVGMLQGMAIKDEYEDWLKEKAFNSGADSQI